MKRQGKRARYRQRIDAGSDQALALRWLADEVDAGRLEVIRATPGRGPRAGVVTLEIGRCASAGGKV